MQSVAEQLASIDPDARAKILSQMTEDECKALLYDWRGFHARPDQVAPEGDWDIWLALAGRGWGKTRTGAEWVKEQVENGCMRVAIIAETQKDLEKVMVEGDSGLLSIYPEDEKPKYTKKPVELRFPNGALIQGYNATEPDQLRGPQFEAAWCDELAKWRYARETWDQLQFGMRLGDDPRVFVSTTPKPIQIIKDIVAGVEGKVVVTRGRTMDNSANLASKFLDKICKQYEGTRLGRQELDAEILGDIPNALWTYAQIDLTRVKEAPELGRIVVAIDPAVTSTEESDEHGLIVAGVSPDGHDGYVLEDGSIKGGPLDWARAAVALYDKHGADCVVVEVNQGGDMVTQTLRTVRNNLPIREVRATRGKHVRAEPVSSLYSQGRIHHVGAYPELETQMTMMTSSGYEGEGSPDRLDANVWAFTDLFPSMIVRKEPPKIGIVPRAGSW